MVYISIGSSCVIKHYIDKYNSKNKTLFFDWLMISMKSVIDVLECNDINTILNIDNIIADPSAPIVDNNARIINKKLDFCVSIHDVPAKFTNKDIIEFIDKYKRRYERIINYIKSSEKIVFIRCNNEPKELIDKFITTILTINPACNFTIVFISRNTHGHSILKDKHCLIIETSPTSSITPDWTLNNYDWCRIFSDIKNYS